ncbi:MAG: hypothetical protein A4E28_02013 [Methanocella sp. PtaU1.Bin125]|nr:MAG: hypothetical protein A4E28_02013 [Methanocella sp. PtaU1.Bin125]
MSSKKLIIVLCIACLFAMAAGCLAGSDPLVGVWKQNASGMIVTMELKEGGTGTMSIDMTSFLTATAESPMVETHSLTWKQINETCVRIREANDTSSYHGLFNYDKENKHIWDTTGSTRLDFHKQ